MDFNTYILLNESKGIPLIVKDLTNNVIDNFLKNPEEFLFEKQKDRDIYSIIISGNNVEKPFFSKLYVYITIFKDLNKDSYYKYDLSKWNENLKIFDKVMIEINITNDEIDELKDYLTHELIHAYEDYNRKLNTNKGFSDLEKNTFSLETPEQQTAKENFGNNDKLNLLYHYTYYLLHPERRANIGAVYFELKKYKLTKEDIDNGDYKKLFYYKLYQKINDGISNLVNSLNDEEIKLFGEYIKKSSIKNLYSDNVNLFKRRLIDYMKKRSEETLYKMRKITYEYLSDNNLMENNSFENERKKLLKLMGI
jgi:hypothetical protein